MGYGQRCIYEKRGFPAKAKPAVLRLINEFKTLYYRGKTQVHPLLVTYIRKNKLGFPRYGITTGKKVGGAVQRSRCRRIIRAAYRELLPDIRGGWDFVFVARTRTVGVKSTDVLKVMRRQLKDGGVLV